MRNQFKIIILLLFMTIGFSLLGCAEIFGLSSSQGDGGGDPDNTSTEIKNGKYYISIIYDDDVVNTSFSSISSIRIEPRYQNDNVLLGYYSYRNGGGSQYLDFRGNSVTNSWVRGSTVTLYPYYEKVDSKYVYKSKIAADESPAKYSYNVYGNPKCANYTITADELEYIFKVATSNPNRKMKLTAYADFYDEPTILSIGIGDSISVGKLAERSFPKTSSFVTCSVSTEITGKSILNNEGKKIIIGLFCQTFGAYGIAKNIYYEISLVNGNNLQQVAK